MTLAPFTFDAALLRRPGASVVQGLRARSGLAPELAQVRAEHAAYVAALEQGGVRTEVLAPDEAHPDSMFVEDPALVFAEGAILLRPGAPTRLGETALLGEALAPRFATVETLAEGYADGGDVLVMPELVMIGLSARTDRTGAEALARILAGFGHRSLIVEPPRGALHLKTAATLIDEETVLTTPAGVESGLFAGFRTILIDPTEPSAANALRVNAMLIISSQYPRTAARVAVVGLPMIQLDTTHIARLDGGLTCLSLRYAVRLEFSSS